MSFINHTVVSLRIPSSILVSAAETVQSLRFWCVQPEKPPLLLSEIEEDPIQFDKDYDLFADFSLSRLLRIGDTVKIAGLLKTDGGTYRLLKETQLIAFNGDDIPLPITHPLALPQKVSLNPISALTLRNTIIAAP